MRFPFKQFSRFAALAAAGLCIAVAFAADERAAPASSMSAAVSTAPDTPANASAVKIGPEINIAHLVETRLKPGTRVDSVSKAPFLGLWEVRIGTDLLYTDENVNFLFAGSVYDTKTMTNLTEERINKLTAVKFEDLPFKDSIKLVNGTGKRQIAYFSDPNCPYCKQYEKNLTQLKDTTVYVFLYAILGPDSVKKANALWCAPDRARAWNDWMLRGQMVSPPECSTPVDSNRALGLRLNVRATPTTILANGEKVPGAIPIAQLQKAIDDAGL